jgi:hypothetical protein
MAGSRLRLQQRPVLGHGPRPGVSFRSQRLGQDLHAGAGPRAPCARLFDYGPTPSFRVNYVQRNAAPAPIRWQGKK